MKTIIGIVLILLMGVIGLQLFRLNGERQLLAEKAQKVKEEMEQLKAENEKVKSDIAYFSHPENLGKEIRSLFNYKKPGEEVYIVVPKNQP